MDCKCESAVITGARIGMLVALGVMRSVLCFIIAVVTIPLVPFLVVWVRWVVTRGKSRFLVRVAVSPLWFLTGILIGVFNPFSVLYRNIADTMDIAKVEWLNRWKTGTPKSPDGKPLEQRSEEFKEALDSAVAKSVIRDYAQEAAEHGQPIIPGGNGNE